MGHKDYNWIIDLIREDVEEAWRNGQIKHGDLVLLVAFGSGLTWGATLLRWHEPRH